MSNKRKRLYTVSNAHLDTQWNWTIVDTIRDCVKNTMDYNFKLFEKYPSYKFNFEGAFRYKLMKEYYPDKYEKVKEYVAKGNWNPVGGAWDSMDVNVPSSEALMRQVLYGNKYFEKEFSKTTEDIFLPDCFGFRAALPSIASHMGLIGFSTQKLVWGSGAPMLAEDGKLLRPMPKSELPRVDLARWKGPDGNEVFTSFLCGNYTYNFDKESDTRPLCERKELEEKIDMNGKNSGVYARSIYYGTGDYGGSCSEGSARLIDEAVNAPGEGLFDVISASPTQIYHDLTPEEIEKLPVYEGGLLIPHGYGAMTSHSAMKRLNRKNESAADSAERVSVLAELLTGEKYPRERIEGAWKNFLWHQFHDDITGTSVADAYLYSHNDMIISGNIFAKERENSVANVAGALNTDVAGTPIAVYNPCAFARKEAVTVRSSECEYKNPVVKTRCGEEIPTYSYKDKEYTYITFLPDLKPLSVEVFELAEGEGKFESALFIGEDTFENENIKVQINEKGEICSIFDKNLEKEILSAPVREEIYEDNSTVWPSWEYEFEDFQKEPTLLNGEVTIEKIDMRPVSVGFKVTLKHGASTFEKVYTICAGGKGVTIDALTDWQERPGLLTIKFPMTAENPEALFDGDLGAEKGENTTSYPYFIHNVHKWADLTDKSGEYGVTVANDCKYAAAKPDDKTLSFVLIHTPKANYMPSSGQDYQDIGYNKYSFYIEAHNGDKPAVNSAVAINNPVTVYEAEKHTGGASFVSLVGELPGGVELRAVKKAEDSEEIVIRLQESYGVAHEGVEIKFNGCKITKAVRCNGYETEIAPARFEGGSIFTDISRYGVQTFKLTLEHEEFTPVSADEKALELEYDTDLLCAMGESKEKEGKYIPAELYPENIFSCGTKYELSKGENKVLTAKGQKIEIPAGYSNIKLLCAVKGSSKDVTLLLDENELNIKVSAFNEFVGSRTIVVNGSFDKNTDDEIAYVITHTKNEKGEDNLYDFAYIFSYDIPLNGARTLTLPEDEELLVFGATLTNKGKASPMFPMFDELPGMNDVPTHELTVVGLRRGGGKYREGAMVLLFAPKIRRNEIFKGFKGEGIVSVDKGYALVKMGDHDITIEAEYDCLGENIAENKPCSANHEMNERESAAKAVDGKGRSKWCGDCDENGICTLNIDLEGVYEPKSYLICHAGDIESMDWNTVDFDILVKEKEEDEFTVADSVRGNTESVTRRELKCGKVRYVTLKILKPASDKDTHARIYHFGIFE